MFEATENRYRGSEGRAYQDGKRSVPPQAFRWLARLRAEKFQPYIQRTDEILEIGAGLGWNLAELNCARRVGTDLQDFLAAELKNQGLEFFGSSTELADRSFDVIICHHVLEHVEGPASMLAEIHRVLRVGGKLLLHVPFEKERRYRRFNSAEPNHHLYSWNVQTLGNLVQDAGFQIVSAGVGEFGYDRAAANWALRLHGGEKLFRLLRRVAHLCRPALEVRVVAEKGHEPNAGPGSLNRDKKAGGETPGTLLR
jgi:SAM-dependent methyltransferase